MLTSDPLELLDVQGNPRPYPKLGNTNDAKCISEFETMDLVHLAGNPDKLYLVLPNAWYMEVETGNRWHYNTVSRPTIHKLGFLPTYRYRLVVQRMVN